MPNYREMYFTLHNGINDIISQLRYLQEIAEQIKSHPPIELREAEKPEQK